MKNKAALYFALIIFAHAFFFLPKNVLAQSQKYWQDYCNKIATLPAPQDLSEPSFVEPTWDELDNLTNSIVIDKAGVQVDTTHKTTVRDTFDLTDTANSDTGAYGGTLTISNLSLPHAKEIADYLEGRFLDEDHRMADFRTFNESQFLLYYGPLIKLMPQKTLDKLKAGYIDALLDRGIRQSGKNPGTSLTPDMYLTFADVCGQNPRTIYDLAKAWGVPSTTPGSWSDFQIIQMPRFNPNATPDDWRSWNNTWGRYWPKIPVHDPGARLYYTTPAGEKAVNPEMNINSPPNMRSRGCLVFTRVPLGQRAGC